MGVVLYALYYFSMKLVIINISPIVAQLVPVLNSIVKTDYPFNKLEACVDACIFRSFNNVFCLSIINKTDKNEHVYNEIYQQVRYWLDSSVRLSVNPNEFNVFNGCELKAIASDEVLFIIESGNYVRH
jgi:hypothetical protein